MKIALLALLILPLRAASPNYSASSILNAASNVAGPLAPNTIVSLYGTDLSWNTRVLRGDDLSNGLIPSYLLGGGVTVLVNSTPAGLFYVSPTQINFLMPADMPGGRARVAVLRDGRHGPEVQISVSHVAPALFQLDPDFVVATRPDGSGVDREHPARPGEIIILYANGLGPVLPPLGDRAIAPTAASLVRASEFFVLLDGVTLPREYVQYVGAAPGFAGLYQINLQLPDLLNTNPEIRIGIGSVVSRESVRLIANP